VTQQQLKDLITGTLGPIVDAAMRIVDCGGRTLTSADIALKAQLDAATITQGDYDAGIARLKAQRNLEERLVVLIQLARHGGTLTAAPATNSASMPAEQFATRADSDWASIVAA
jgi:hypothetical protein